MRVNHTEIIKDISPFVSSITALSNVRASLLYGGSILDYNPQRDIDIEIIYDNPNGFTTKRETYEGLADAVFASRKKIHCTIITYKEIKGAICSPLDIRWLQTPGYILIHGDDSIEHDLESNPNQKLRGYLNASLGAMEGAKRLPAIADIGNLLVRGRRNYLKAILAQLEDDKCSLLSCLYYSFENTFLRCFVRAIGADPKEAQSIREVMMDVLSGVLNTKTLTKEMKSLWAKKERALMEYRRFGKLKPSDISKICQEDKDFVEKTTEVLEKCLLSQIKFNDSICR